MKTTKNSVVGRDGGVRPAARTDAGWRLPGGSGLADYALRAGFLAPALFAAVSMAPAGRTAAETPVRARGRVR